MSDHYFSRSARETDDTCPRRRYWETVHGGRGLSPASDARELLLGSAVHFLLAYTWSEVKNLQEMEGWQYAGETLEGTYTEALSALHASCEEWPRLSAQDQWLVQCLFRAYVVHVLPRYLAEWDVLYVEQELRLTRGELILLCQPDVILRNRRTGRVRYLEYKTTKLLTGAYIESWRFSPQLAAGKAAALETLGLQIDEAVMGFFDKGSESHKGDYWNSPFTSYWEKGEERSAKRPQYFKGWSRFTPSERFTVDAWVDQLPVEIVLGQMPESMPVEVDDRLVEAWLDESFGREAIIASSARYPTSFRDAGDFPHRFKQCRPVIGRICPFLDLCWNPTLEADPLASGLYVPRTPHHRAEREALGLLGGSE